MKLTKEQLKAIIKEEVGKLQMDETYGAQHPEERPTGAHTFFGTTDARTGKQQLYFMKFKGMNMERVVAKGFYDKGDEHYFTDPNAIVFRIVTPEEAGIEDPESLHMHPYSRSVGPEGRNE